MLVMITRSHLKLRFKRAQGSNVELVPNVFCDAWSQHADKRKRKKAHLRMTKGGRSVIFFLSVLVVIYQAFFQERYGLVPETTAGAPRNKNPRDGKRE